MALHRSYNRVRRPFAAGVLACGLIAANLYFAQPLIGLIGPELGLTPAQSGLIVTLTAREPIAQAAGSR